MVFPEQVHGPVSRLQDGQDDPGAAAAPAAAAARPGRDQHVGRVHPAPGHPQAAVPRHVGRGAGRLPGPIPHSAGSAGPREPSGVECGRDVRRGAAGGPAVARHGGHRRVRREPQAPAPQALPGTGGEETRAVREQHRDGRASGPDRRAPAQDDPLPLAVRARLQPARGHEEEGLHRGHAAARLAGLAALQRRPPGAVQEPRQRAADAGREVRAVVGAQPGAAGVPGHGPAGTAGPGLQRAQPARTGPEGQPGRRVRPLQLQPLHDGDRRAVREPAGERGGAGGRGRPRRRPAHVAGAERRPRPRPPGAAPLRRGGRGGPRPARGPPAPAVQRGVPRPRPARQRPAPEARRRARPPGAGGGVLGPGQGGGRRAVALRQQGLVPVAAPVDGVRAPGRLRRRPRQHTAAAPQAARPPLGPQHAPHRLRTCLGDSPAGPGGFPPESFFSSVEEKSQRKRKSL
ncbi:hypothetical protein ONE63_001317 [Megalurothrips usitatus]|uniref:Collagen alpha-1(I) chain-like n=1 Tax=Megalurothrips usitatus TaxID=439358 RepID=A0AAV7XFH2_9NEOP|nr:hypothetical protein ONE63_001317 [Megalurothrips usitatus]